MVGQARFYMWFLGRGIISFGTIFLKVRFFDLKGQRRSWVEGPTDTYLGKVDLSTSKTKTDECWAQWSNFPPLVSIMILSLFQLANVSRPTSRSLHMIIMEVDRLDTLCLSRREITH